MCPLVSYLHPDVFTDSTNFDTAFNLTKNICDAAALGKAHHLLRLFQLRRLKARQLAMLGADHVVYFISVVGAYLGDARVVISFFCGNPCMHGMRKHAHVVGGVKKKKCSYE